MAIFDAFFILADSGVYFDEGYNFDGGPGEIIIEIEDDFEKNRYVANETKYEDIITVDMELEVNYIKFVNLWPLVPLKFRGDLV